MRSGMWLPLFVFALPTFAACAAVPDDDWPRPLPAEDSTGAFGTDGSADSNAVPACGVLELAGPLLGLAQHGADLIEPQWVLGPRRDDPVYLYTASVIPAEDRFLQRATLDPWSAQPPTFGELAPVVNIHHAPMHGDAFAVAQLLPLHEDENFESLIISRQRHITSYPKPWHWGPYFRSEIAWRKGSAPHRPAGGGGIGTLYGHRMVSFRSIGTEQFGISEVQGPGPRYAMMASTITERASHMVGFGLAIGCATTPIAVDAAWWEEDVADWPRRFWLFGAAVGVPTDWKTGWRSCDEKFPGVGPATILYLGRYFSDGNSPTGDAISSNEVSHEAAPVVSLRMAPRPDGAWLAWTLAPLEGAPSALRVARMTPTARFALPPVTVPSCFTPVAASLDAEQVDGDLVVAVVETVEDDSDRIVLRRFDAEGRVIWMATLRPNGKVEGRLSVLAQRGRGLLVAWAERPSSVSASELRAARFGCAEGAGGFVAEPVCDTEEPHIR